MNEYIKHVLETSSITKLASLKLDKHMGEWFLGGSENHGLYFPTDCISFVCMDKYNVRNHVTIIDCRGERNIVYLEVRAEQPNGDWWEHDAMFTSIKDVYPYCINKLELL